MEPVTLEISKRQELGSAASRRYREAGFVPSVVYADGERAIPALLNDRAFVRLAERIRGSRAIVLQSEDAQLNQKFVVVKEIQKDHLKNRVLHVDLHMLHEDRQVQIEVLVKPVGLAYGVKNEAGILTISSRTVGVKCLPHYIPELLEVDVSDLHLGQSVHARDLKLPENVKLHSAQDLTILAVVSGKKAHMEEVTVVPEAVAAEAAPEGAEGAAPAEAAGEGAKTPAKAASDEKTK